MAQKLRNVAMVHYVLLNYILENALFKGKKLILETISGFYEVIKINKKKYKVSMGRPNILSKYKNLSYEKTVKKFSLILNGR